ncbi:MAG: hypothetical protein NXH75_12110, partial [Halobacteriovoraceae bacterium]|nr:hypothetical protein [Halobacteriovoraceae bacterium]
MTAAQDEIAVIMRERSAGVISDRGRFDEALRAFEESKTEYLQALRSKRTEIAPNLLKEDPNLKLAEVIEELYPELRYGDDLSRTMSASQIRNVELEVSRMIGKVDDPVRAKQLSMEFNHYRSNPGRVERAIDDRRYFNPQEVMVNARLSPAERSRRGFEIAQRNTENMAPEDLLRLKKGINDAHLVGTKRGAGVFEYTPTEIAQKFRTLREAGFTSKESSNLIRSGIAGDVPLELADFTRFNDDLFTELLKHVPENSNPALYREFLTNNKKSLDRLVKSKDLRPQDMIFENFKTFKHSNGNEYVYIKDMYGKEFIFTLDGKSMKFLGRDSYLPIRDFVKKNGPVFRESADGDYLVFSRKYDEDIEVLRATPIRPPQSRKEMASWRAEVAQKYPAPDTDTAKLFEDFAISHEKELLEMFKTGKVLPHEVSPSNFHKVYDTTLDKDVYLLLPKGKETNLSDGLFFTIGKKDKVAGMTSGRLGRLEMGDIDRTFIFNDRRYISLKSHPLGFRGKSLYTGESAITRQSLKETKYFDSMENFVKKSLKGDTLDEWSEMYKANRGHMEEALVTQKAGPFDFAPGTFKTFTGSDGVKYAMFANQPFDQSLILRMDGKPLAKGIQIAEAKDHLAKFGGDLDFSDGSFIRAWNEGGVTKYHYTPKVDSELRYLADDIQRKFDIQTRAGARVNEEFISFVRSNEAILKKAIRDGSLKASDIQPSSFARITSDTGEEFYLVGRINNGMDAIFLPVNKSITPPRGFITFDEIHNFGNTFKSKNNALEMVYDSTQEIKWSVRNGNISLLSADGFSTGRVIEQASASFADKAGLAEKVTGESLTLTQKRALNEALLFGGKAGPSVFDYSLAEIKSIRKILIDGGFSQADASYLVRSGIAARPPTRYTANSTGIFAKDFSRMTSRTFDQKLGDLESLLSNGKFRDNPLSPAEA